MLIINGEVRKTIDYGYTDKKTGEYIEQGVLIIEPDDTRQNYEIYLTAKQVKEGIRDTWEALRGKKASVAVSLYVNHQYKFHKFTAKGDAKPIGVKKNV